MRDAARCGLVQVYEGHEDLMRAVRGTAIEQALVPPVKLPSKHTAKRAARHSPLIAPEVGGGHAVTMTSAVRSDLKL